jgi:predicted nucleic acid-binding protein
MQSGAYPDSSFLVSLYRADPNQPAAHAFMARRSLSLAFLPLHRLELRNALRFAEKQGLLSSQDRRGTFQQVEDDLRGGLLVHAPIPWNDIFRRADDLSEKYFSTHAQRTLDLLHVAAALESGHRLFLSFDQRQRGLAKATGLTVKP